jgi:hypothetical protein
MCSWNLELPEIDGEVAGENKENESLPQTASSSGSDEHEAISFPDTHDTCLKNFPADILKVAANEIAPYSAEMEMAISNQVSDFINDQIFSTIDTDLWSELGF